MNLKWYYWYFESVIPERICDDIIRYGQEQEKQMALTGNADKEKLSKEELQNIQKKENQMSYGCLIGGYTMKYSPIYTKLILTLVGILNGIGLRLASLLNTKLVNIMIGIAIHTKSHTTDLKTQQFMANKENLV